MTGSALVRTIGPDLVEIDGSHVLDFRARDKESSTTLCFELPMDAISEQDGWKKYGRASDAHFKTFSRTQFRKKFGKINFRFDTWWYENATSGCRSIRVG